jgi:glycosyltransferase involved in cell wall biosynthesis
MRIAFIGLRGVPAQYGGIERAVEEVGARLVEQGHHVTVYCMANRYADRPDSHRGMRLLYVPTIPTRSLEMICYAFPAALTSCFRRHDVVNFLALGSSTMAWLPQLIGRKTVATVQGLDWKRDKWGRLARAYLKFGEWTSRRLPNRTIVVSQQLKQYYDSMGPRHAVYIPNGANAAAPVPLGGVAERFELSPREYLLYVGRMTREKNLHVLIEAFRRLDTSKKLVILGGSSNTDDYVAELRRLAEGDRRIVFTGPLYGEQLAQVFSNPYLFVLPSALEGLPLALLEALAYGNCVLLSDIPENREVIDDEGTLRGFTFPSGCTDRLRDVLEHLLANPAEVEQMRSRSSALVEKKYNWDRIAERTLQLYQEVLAG